MPWLRTSDDCMDSLEAHLAGEDAMNLWWRARLFCARALTDGNVPRNALRTLTGKEKPEALAALLVKHGFWEVTEDGWLDPGYLDDNPPAERVIDQRKGAKERKNRWLARKRAEEEEAAQRVPEHRAERVPSRVAERVGNGCPVPVPQKLKNDDDEKSSAHARKSTGFPTGGGGKPVKGARSAAAAKGHRFVEEQPDADGEAAPAVRPWSNEFELGPPCPLCGDRVPWMRGTGGAYATMPHGRRGGAACVGAVREAPS